MCLSQFAIVRLSILYFRCLLLTRGSDSGYVLFAMGAYRQHTMKSNWPRYFATWFGSKQRTQTLSQFSIGVFVNVICFVRKTHRLPHRARFSPCPAEASAPLATRGLCIYSTNFLQSAWQSHAFVFFSASCSYSH